MIIFDSLPCGKQLCRNIFNVKMGIFGIQINLELAFPNWIFSPTGSCEISVFAKKPKIWNFL